tara:strand:+ start:2164 stop:2421 length:258 start_codon:yes stop_codon:yes gene_type:complete
MIDNSGNKLTTKFLEDSNFRLESYTDSYGDESREWFRDGVTIYEDDDSFSFATLTRSDGSFKSGFLVKTDQQVKNIYCSITNKEF